MSRDKTLPPEDAALWAHITQDVTPMRKANVTPTTAEAPTQPAPRRAHKAHTLPQHANARADIVKPAAPTGGLDRSTRTKLERGQMPIEAVLDLHGDTHEGAQMRTQAFLLQSWRAGKRCVLVITGKGKGVLKSGFADWASQPPLRDIILHLSAAQGKHGGSGAFYVLLRRIR